MQQDDLPRIAVIVGLVVTLFRALAVNATLHALEGILDDLGDPRTLPVFGIDVQPDIGVAEALRHQGRNQFIGCRRLGVTEIGRTQQAHRPAGIGLDDALGRVEFEANLPFRDLGHVRMGIGMVADIVAILDHLPQQGRVTDRLFADDEEGCRHVLLFQDLEDLRRPAAVRPVVEGQGQLARNIAGAADDKRCRQAGIGFVLGDMAFVEGNGTRAVLRHVVDMDDFAIAERLIVADRRQTVEVG